MGDASLVPVLLSLLAASLFGGQAVLARRSLRYVNAQTGSMVTILTAGTVFWSIFIWRVPGAQWSSPAIWVYLSNGLVHPMFSMWLSFEANRRMGATVSATVAATTPLFASAAALLWLREGVTPQILLGTLAVVLGVIVLSWARGAARGWAHSALVFPTGAAIVRAFNHVWGRFGMLLLPAPLMAATLSFSVSGTLAVLTYRLRTGHLPARIPLRGLLWAGSGGLCVSAAILSMYTALTTGSVVVVSPVIGTYPVFTLGWALLFRQEALSPRILAGVLLVVAGITLISLR